MHVTLLAAGLVPRILAMHAPDGLYSMPVNVVFGAVVVLVLAGALASLARHSDYRRVPLMGIMGAFVFAGQMVNFPIASGTTGHLLGGTLAAILLGPAAGTVVMAVVVFFQALLGDGGVTVLGPNIFNMGVVGTCLAYFVYRVVVGRAGDRPARVVAASFFAAWLAVVLASVFASLQLAVSGTVTLQRALPAMVLTHMAIGVGEALITAAAVAFVVRARPDLLYGHAGTAGRPLGRPVIALGLGASLIVAVFLSLLPTLWDYPDGLESIGIAKGFLREQPQVGDDGSLTTLPAYPLGVRLALVDGRVTAVHRYDQQATLIAVGDVLERVNDQPAASLAAVAQALKFDAAKSVFDVEPGQTIPVAVLRDGVARAVSVLASAAPAAGGLPPLVALLPDYTVPGVKGLLSTSLAGAIGTVIMFVVSLAVGRVLLRPGRLAVAAARQPGRGTV